MSTSIYFFVEVQDKEKKWHLAKYYTDYAFVENEPTEWDFEKVVNVDGKKMIEKYELWTGLAWRDELVWRREDAPYGLPSDVSEELKTLLEEMAEKEKNKGIYPSDYDYSRRYSYIYIDEMWKISKEKINNWKNSVKKHVRDEQLEDIKRRIAHLEKIALKKTDKAMKEKKGCDDEIDIDYLLDEDLSDIVTLEQETSELYNLASQFSGNSWIDFDKVRVIYYFN